MKRALLLCATTPVPGTGDVLMVRLQRVAGDGGQ
jgi:hypothetical protein